MNCLLYSISCFIYSLNKENGGFVTTISDCSKSFLLSSELKSQLHFKSFIKVQSLVFSKNCAFSPVKEKPIANNLLSCSFSKLSEKYLTN